MIFVVPCLLTRARERVASVALVEASTFQAAEQAVYARFAGATAGDAVELDLEHGPQFIEVASWEPRA